MGLSQGRRAAIVLLTIALGALVLITMGLILRTQSQPIITADPSTESCLATRINAERGAVGVPPVSLLGSLAAAARSHSEAMATSGDIYHSDIRAQYGRTWKLIGENVGVSESCVTLHAAFMGSEHHRANVLDARWTNFGLGAARDDGQVFATEAFVQGAPAPAPPPPVTSSPAPPPPPKPSPTCRT